MIVRFLCSLAGLALLVCSGFAFAAPPWPEGSFTYIADNQPLPEVLRRFARSFGMETQLSANVAASNAMVSGKITTASATEFINQLGAAHGLSWFAQNGVLYVSRSSERSTRAVSPPGISAAGLKKALGDLGVLEPKFGWGEVPERGIVLISGPPAYVDLLVRAVTELPPMPPDQELEVFRLRHASVDDRTIFYRDKQIVTAGVASILRGLISGIGSTGGTNIMLSEVATPLRGTLAPLNPLDGEPPRIGDKAAPSVTVPPAPGAVGRAVIQADSRLNAVIIKDRPENMQIFRQLISLLDVPSQLVEIEAMIIDVNVDQLAQLGIDWSARAGKVGLNVGDPTLATASPSAILAVGGANAATVIADAGRYLLARVNALETRGDARIVSRPSVLTVDNLGALIDLSDTVYIQSIGERVANVVPVSVGVTLRVTPHIIEQDGGKAVQLVVDIEDGSFQDGSSTKALPRTRRSNIGTQAVMGERESLLIGGFNRDEQTKNRTSVPVLGELPIIGGLFGSTSRTSNRTERLFLITPRIIQNAAATAAAAASAARNEPVQIGRDNTLPAGTRNARTTAAPITAPPAVPTAVPDPAMHAAPAPAWPPPDYADRNPQTENNSAAAVTKSVPAISEPGAPTPSEPAARLRMEDQLRSTWKFPRTTK